MTSKEEIIKQIAENSNGSWVDMITEGYEAAATRAEGLVEALEKISSEIRVGIHNEVEVAHLYEISQAALEKYKG